MFCSQTNTTAARVGSGERQQLPLLDKHGRDNRRIYFVPRTLGTLSELRTTAAVRLMNARFNDRKAASPDGAVDGWNVEQDTVSAIKSYRRRTGQICG
jgi:hypothetical protein